MFEVKQFVLLPPPVFLLTIVGSHLPSHTEVSLSLFYNFSLFLKKFFCVEFEFTDIF